MQKKKTARQIIAASLLLVWVILIIDAFLFTSTADVHYSPYFQPRIFPSPSNDIPTLTATISYNFSAKGTFSAENPITVSVSISDVNTTNLLQYYGELGFFGSVFNSSTPQYLGPGEEEPGYIFLKPGPNATYVGTATLVWHVESDVYTFLLPLPQLWNFVLKLGPNSGEPLTMHISSSSDTFNWKFNELTTKLTLVLVGFSVLMLQPIFEALFHLKDDNNKHKD